ncbi:MAG TPA: tRNA pseudouridine synthase A, partial [Arcobacter sp.]|nr:tRNA pseudouridine synthase A [Arcobacter sp.]
SPIDLKETTYRLNALLPKSIVIQGIYSVIPNAHARFDAISRSYEYHICLKNNPFILDTSWQVTHKQFDLTKMNQAAGILLKHTDFKAFSKSKTDVKTYLCTIETAYWEKSDDSLIFYITANRFLRNMVRAIVGTLLDLGLHKISLAEFEQIVESRDRSKSGLSVPAKGLFLTKISYRHHIFNP